MRIGGAYYHHPSIRLLARDMLHGGWQAKMRPEALIFAGRHLVKGWTVMDRLGEITVPTLVMAGRDDFIFPPEHQAELAAGIPMRACGSSSALATTRTRNSPPRSWRQSETSSPERSACQPPTLRPRGLPADLPAVAGPMTQAPAGTQRMLELRVRARY